MVVPTIATDLLVAVADIGATWGLVPIWSEASFAEAESHIGMCASLDSTL